MARLLKKSGGLLSFLDDEEEDEDQAPDTSGSLIPSPPAAMPPAAKADQPGYWDGGDKFTWRDGAAGALAAVGDALTTQAGGRAFALPMLTQGRTARAKAQAAIRAAQQTAADLQAKGLSAVDARLLANDPKAIGTNMAERLGSYTLSNGQTRYNGSDLGAERPDLIETPTGDRRQIFADGTNREVYRETSPTYQNVDGVGVFAMDRHRPGVMDSGVADQPVGRLVPYNREAADPGGDGAGFTPDAAQMRDMYMRQFGPAGEAMFNEWLRNSRAGGR